MGAVPRAHAIGSFRWKKLYLGHVIVTNIVG